jgi:hypothetical protein
MKMPLKRVDVNGKIILKLILRKLFGRVWTEFMWHAVGTGCGLS